VGIPVAGVNPERYPYPLVSASDSNPLSLSLVVERRVRGVGVALPLLKNEAALPFVGAVPVSARPLLQNFT